MARLRLPPRVYVRPDAIVEPEIINIPAQVSPDVDDAVTEEDTMPIYNGEDESRKETSVEMHPTPLTKKQLKAELKANKGKNTAKQVDGAERDAGSE